MVSLSGRRDTEPRAAHRAGSAASDSEGPGARVFQAPTHPFPPVVSGLQRLQGRTHFRPGSAALPLMKMKRTLSWRKARTHPATGLSGSRCGSPRRRAAVFREASADRPSHLTPRVSIAAWSGCGCVFPGIGPKQRHRKTRRIRNQFQASPEPACLRQTSAR